MHRAINNRRSSCQSLLVLSIHAKDLGRVRELHPRAPHIRELLIQEELTQELTPRSARRSNRARVKFHVEV